MTRWIAEFVILVNHQTMAYKIPLESSDDIDAAKEMKDRQSELQDVKGFVVMSKNMKSVSEEEYFSPEHYNENLKYKLIQSHVVHHSDDEDEFKEIENAIQKDIDQKRKGKSEWQKFKMWLSRYFSCNCRSSPEKKGYAPIDMLEQDPLLNDDDSGHTTTLF